MIEPDTRPPIASVRSHDVSSPFGVRSDPYYWLRDDDRQNPEVLAYLEAENAYRQRQVAELQPLEDLLYREIVARLKQDDSSVPYRKDGYWYSTRFEPGKEHPIFVRRKDAVDAPEEILIDGNARAEGHEYHQIASLEVSPDATLLAFCEDTVGRREYTLRFKDLVTGELLSDAIPNVEPDLAWANDNRTVLYVEKDPETLLGLFVKSHKLGTDSASDRLVFEQTDKSFYTGVSKSKSERYIFIHMESTVSSEWRYADADEPVLEFKIFQAHERDHEYQIEHLRDFFIVRTNWRARNFCLRMVPIGQESDRARWQELIAQQDDTFIEDFEQFEGFLAISVRSGGLSKINIRPWIGHATLGEQFFIASDEPAYATAIAANPEIGSSMLRYVYSSMTTPATVYDYDMRTHEQILLKRDPVIGDFRPEDYRTEFVFAPARDGTQIPVSLVYRKGWKRDGTAPMLQYAYGAYGLSTEPSFSSSRLSLLDRGFVYAIAHVRGGQEMGRAWYDAGRLLNKKRSFTDFIDVTHYLVAQRYAAADAVFAMGGSAGGLLMGAVANLSPGDYRGIIAQVPFIDVVTTMLDDTIPLTTNEYDEWGNPTDRRFYDYMLSYSPYDNVSAQAYPAMLVTTGLWDSQVQYYEPAKWVAKLRAAKTDENDLFLHIDMEAGHGGKSGRFQRYREIAMEYVFILGQLGIRG